MAAGTLAVLATGGTIGNTTAERIPIDRVLADLAPVSPRASSVETFESRRIAGSAIAPGDWSAIRDQACELLERDDVGGLVVTHGTFTVEETAFFLHLTLPTSKPVAVTCAQRKHDALSEDGSRNLLDALDVVASGKTTGLGVVVVTGQEIHSARDVVKLSQHPGGFGSRDLGLMGTIEDGEIAVYRSPLRRHTAGSELACLRPGAELPRVDIVETYAGADAVPIDAFVAAGARGIVLNGFPYSGKPTDAQAAGLARAEAAGCAVVVANRGIHGRVPARRDGPGVGADDLTAPKARILLMLALAAGLEADLPRVFAEY
ncbi:MAG: asparaginase domain-containing protein [Chloroflexota bacterium]